MVVNFAFNYPTVGIYYPTVVEGEMIVLHRTIHVAVRKSALGAGFRVISAIGAGFLGCPLDSAPFRSDREKNMVDVKKGVD